MNEEIKKYESIRPLYEGLSQKLKDLLIELLNAKNIKFDKIEARAKTIDSFIEKISRPDKHYTSPLNEITDLCGLRVIVYYREDVKNVEDLIRKEFSINESHSTNKLEELEPDKLGYISTHIVVSNNSIRANLIEWERFNNMQAEIQIRTVLQHAWASISHALQYKHELEIPKQFRRKLLRLSGLMELADEQFSDLKLEKENLELNIYSKLTNKEFDIPIDLTSIESFIEKSQKAHDIGDMVYKLGFRNSILDSTQLFNLCSHLKIDSIEELESNLLTSMDFAFEFFSEFAKDQETKNQSISGSISHWVAVLLFANNLDKINSFDLWSDEYTKSIIKCKNRIAKT